MNEEFIKKRGILYLKNNKLAASFKYKDKVVGYYRPQILTIEQTKKIRENLDSIQFSRVMYKSPYSKINCTPRLTWAYGVSPQKIPKTGILYRKLNFNPEPMPKWLNKLAIICRKIAISVRGFDPEYNSCIIGKYLGGEDNIKFHTDAETFLSTKLCANVTIGSERDFHFKFGPEDKKVTYGIKLAESSLFLFDSLEHALPERKAVKNQVRYSISFRNMANNIGIGNSYYYCRGLAGAINDEAKYKYIEDLKKLYTQERKSAKITDKMFNDFIDSVVS